MGGESNTSVAIKEDGTLWAWGNNNNGQLGDATSEDRTTPVRVIVSGW
ncbi:MAG: RCC1 domain-containing protein [Spirochaetes bacterium]|nr:RCC1 domain-containing protein [Spirochaetota bacterium]